MKKQILVFTVMALIGFFTACEQPALIDPEVIMEQEEMPQAPQEALDALEVLIDSNFAESELETRCDSHPDAYGIATGQTVALPRLYCGREILTLGSTGNSSSAWIYYHIDEREVNGSNYYLIDSGMKYSRFYISQKIYKSPFPTGTCDYRAYVYIWDANCGVWKRLTEQYIG